MLHAEFHPQVVSQQLSRVLRCKLQEKIDSCNSTLSSLAVENGQDAKTVQRKKSFFVLAGMLTLKAANIARIMSAFVRL